MKEGMKTGRDTGIQMQRRGSPTTNLKDSEKGRKGEGGKNHQGSRTEIDREYKTGQI